MKEPVKFGIILLVFCALSAGLLAAVNSFTAPVIAETELKNTLASYEVIFGDAADSFEEYDFLASKIFSMFGYFSKHRKNLCCQKR